MRRWILTALIALAVTTVSQGYYHFLHYEHREGQLVPLPRKFDLAALPNQTISYFISGAPELFAGNDSMPSLVSQIQLAARQWNDVDTSSLRLQFGGFTSELEGQSTPGIDILFAEIPPGVIAYGGPTQPFPAVISADGQFYPISRSQVVLPKDVSTLHSFDDSFFLTIVHELGHALGLQHTLTNSVMSTSLTRTQTKSNSLGADDVAGISFLYPTPSFRSSLGSVTGRIVSGDHGVALASVVAISKRGAAVSALTAPDGTYRIDGVWPGEYFIYVSSLPPAQSGEATPANIQLPIGPEGVPIQPAPPFDLQFYPGVRDHAQATLIPVTAGSSVDGVNFNVAYRSEPLKLYNVLSYSFPGQIAVRPAQINVNGNRHYFVATGKGLMENDQPAFGLQAAVLGGDTFISGIHRYYTDYLQFDLQYTEQSGQGKRHLVFSNGTDVYVAPGALSLVNIQPPQITEVVPLENQKLQLKGTNLLSNTVIFFDGVPAIVESHDAEAGTLVVTPPSASNGQRAAIIAFNGDGQNSFYLDGDIPQSTILAGQDQPSFVIHPHVFPQGRETLIDIYGTNTNFTEGAVSIGFGTSDIVAKKIWVKSPTHAIAQVQVSPNATLSYVNTTVTSGLQQVYQPVSFWIGSPDPEKIPVRFSNVNVLTGIAHGTADGLLTVSTGDLQGHAPIFLIGDRAAHYEILESGEIFVRIPPDLLPGPATFSVQAGGRSSFPLMIEVDFPAPQITLWNSTDEVHIEGTYSALINEQLTLNLAGDTKPVAPFQKVRTTVRVGDVEHLASLQGNRVYFTLLPSVPEGEHTMSLTVDGRLLGALPLIVRHQ